MTLYNFAVSYGEPRHSLRSAYGCKKFVFFGESNKVGPLRRLAGTGLGLMLIKGDVPSKRRRKLLVLLLFGEFKSLLRGCYGLRILPSL